VRRRERQVGTPVAYANARSAEEGLADVLPRLRARRYGEDSAAGELEGRQDGERQGEAHGSLSVWVSGRSSPNEAI